MFRKVLAAAAAALIASTFVTAPARADIDWGSAKPTLWVNETVGAAWDSALRDSLVWVDGYTKSQVRFGPCRSGSRCVTVRQGTATKGHGAWTVGGNRAVITLHPNSARYAWDVRRALIDHEIGSHVCGVGHNPRPTSRAHTPLLVKGKLVPRVWTSAERAVLSRC